MKIKIEFDDLKIEETDICYRDINYRNYFLKKKFSNQEKFEFEIEKFNEDEFNLWIWK